MKKLKLLLTIAVFVLLLFLLEAKFQLSAFDPNGMLGTVVGNCISVWPVLFILFVIRIIAGSRKIKRVCLILFVAVVLIAAGLLPMFSVSLPSFSPSDSLARKLFETEEDGLKTYHISGEGNIRIGEISIAAGGCGLSVQAAESTFVQTNLEQLSVSELMEGDKLQVEVVQTRSGFKTGKSLSVSLDRAYQWAMTIETGASDSIIDLRELNTPDITLNLGAGRVKAHIGRFAPETFLQIEGGASDITIYLPLEMGILITTPAGIMKTNFKQAGIEKQMDGSYVTPGFETAEHKIYVTLSTGLSNIEIIRE